ncbi:hypothetical protein C2G38_2048960 [Gigaspora rosea]|uniref:Uncharacterized protein n=1 Tax=Gigaspora rosea TaxID=44941 RepID=A0A397U462_9GLOM|nr:hypothetical protein C2G38_2048960 [Gigaspora rosea]
MPNDLFFYDRIESTKKPTNKKRSADDTTNSISKRTRNQNQQATNHERDVDLVPLSASSSYKNDDTIRPSLSVRRNDSATPLPSSSSDRGDDITLSSPISSSGDLPSSTISTRR